jgi:hypothetical protein
MLPTYNLICVPLETRNPTETTKSFEVRIVSELQFPMEASHDPATIRGALAQHPLLTRSRSQPLNGFIWDYQSWERNGHSIDPNVAARVSLTFAGTGISLDSALANLLNYLGAAAGPLTATLIPTNSRFEMLADDHYVDVIKAADELKLLKHTLRVSALNQLTASINARQGSRFQTSTTKVSALTDLGPLSFALAKWIDGSTHASLLAALMAPDDRTSLEWLALFGDDAVKIQGIRTAINKIARRISERTETSCGSSNQLAAIGTTGDTHQVPLSDPNVAIHAALKNSLLAESCGLVTTWTVQSSLPMLGGQNFVIQLDHSSLLYDKSKVEVQNAIATAFRRDTHTHPVAFADLALPETRNGALACLNDTGSVVRYRAASVNSETGLVKEVILQAANSFSGPTATESECSFGDFNPPRNEVDARPPQMLRNDQYGSAEPETSGVVFSAPIEDLIVPPELKRHTSPAARLAALPCLFLEDLWIGYRLDLKQEGGPQFTSTHKQEQQILFSQSRKSVFGITEDYIEREQAEHLEHTSTELTTYNGFSSGQAKEYLRFLGTSLPDPPSANQPFKVTVAKYGKTERLIFGSTYEYRLRNVFLGGVSAASDDSRLNDAHFKERYHQRFPFFRAKALRPGEALSASFENKNESDRRTIYLTADKPEALMTLVPSPIDVDSSRYHGLLFRSKDEVNHHRERKHVGDVGKFFEELPPDELNYFYDPDVYGINVTVTLVNGNDEAGPQDFIYLDNVYCGLSKHFILDPVSEAYGQQGAWEKYRPIVIRFKTTEKLLPSIQKAGNLRGARRLEVEVPQAGELHVTIAPVFNSDLLAKTASRLASSGQLQDIGLAGAAEDTLPVPAIARETFKVIHAIEQPRRSPALIGESAHISAVQPTTGEVSIADRNPDSEFGSIFGRIEIDAASTKEVRLEATWMDVNDNPAQERYTLESGTAASTPRSVIFRAFEPVEPSAAQFKSLFLNLGRLAANSLTRYQIGSSGFGFIDQFVLQCSEDKVFLGRPPAGCPQNAFADVSNRLNLRDQRRKLLKAQAVAVGRFAHHFAQPQTENELRSGQVIVDVPNTLKMSAPRISHVVPLRRALSTGDQGEGSSQATFGFRIYVHKPAFQSGVGERLAIGCFTGGDSPVGVEAELKYVTQWGEDPIERAGLQATMRIPLASDFVAPDNEEESGFDEALYPPNAVGGAAPVIYRDNVAFEPEKAPGKRRFVSLASYALRYDERQHLWYADVYVKTGFFGWCGMAIYRHQPHALPNRELSQTWAWAYAAILYGEPVAWAERQGNLHITIGPIYDANVTFELDSLPYHDGISNEVSQSQHLSQQFASYRVGRATYFEKVIPKKTFDWSLIKRRFGYAVASRHLGQ